MSLPTMLNLLKWAEKHHLFTTPKIHSYEKITLSSGAQKYLKMISPVYHPIINEGFHNNHRYLEVRKITTGPLAGQHGVFAKANISKEGTSFSFGGVIHESTEEKPLDLYSFNINVYSKKIDACFFITAEKNSGICGMINAPNLFDISTDNIKDTSTKTLNPNIVAKDVKLDFSGITLGFPFMYTSRPIKKDEQLLLDYGNDYWKNLYFKLIKKVLAPQPYQEENLCICDTYKGRTGHPLIRHFYHCPPVQAILLAHFPELFKQATVPLKYTDTSFLLASRHEDVETAPYCNTRSKNQTITTETRKRKHDLEQDDFQRFR